MLCVYYMFIIVWMMLVGIVILFFGGMVFFLVVEWFGVLVDMLFGIKLFNSFFISVLLCIVGFNVIDYG